MANYVLVHGGDCDGSLWHNVQETLTQQGHKVLTPSMTSVKNATLTDNINEVISLIDKQQFEDIILCGHSYGAMVITGILNLMPTRVKQLVFLDSTVPENGKSLYGMFQDLGYDYKEFGLTADPACLEELSFDNDLFAKINKTYVHCLQSEFIELTKVIYQKVLQQDNWLRFCLDTKHNCVATMPREIAVILLGIL